MDEPFDHLLPHRRLIGFLETSLDCLEAASEADDTLGVLPHWARVQVRELAAELEHLLAHVAWEAPHVLGPLRNDERLDEDDEEEGA